MKASKFIRSVCAALVRAVSPWLANTPVYYLLLLLISLLALWINYSSVTQVYILTYYEAFARRIGEGLFDSGALTQPGTYPLWGYGFVFYLTHNKTLILVVQQLLNLFVISWTERKISKMSNGENNVIPFRLLILVSFPLFFFHTVLWPYSFSSSFLIMSLYLLHEALQSAGTKAMVKVILSGLSAGIALNFRSDYLFGLLFLFFCLLLYVGWSRLRRRNRILQLTAWLLLVLGCLAPWAFYSRQASGHYLLNSTNAGHVLYIGLGQLPGNKWKIEPYDYDSSMNRLIAEKLHPERVVTTTYAADSLLKQAWKEKVTADPLEFIHKCFYNLGMVFVQPFAEGDGYKKDFSEETMTSIREGVRSMDLLKVAGLMLSHISLSALLSLFSALLGFLLHLYFWYLLIRNIRNLPLFFREDLLFLICFLMFIYQLGLMTGGYYHRNYNTNIYLLYIVMIFFLRKASAPNKALSRKT